MTGGGEGGGDIVHTPFFNLKKIPPKDDPHSGEETSHQGSDHGAPQHVLQKLGRGRKAEHLGAGPWGGAEGSQEALSLQYLMWRREPREERQ